MTLFLNLKTKSLTFANVALPHEPPQEVSTVVAISWLVKRLLNETVAMLVREMVVPHRAGGTGTGIDPTCAPYTVRATLGSHGGIGFTPPFLNFEV